MKDLNKSNCSLINENNDLEVGPFCWHGTVIPEDHMDMAISSFRSNEERWKQKTDKVSFNLLGNKHFDNSGFEQTNRIGQLSFILTNDRILKEKISYILTNKSKISIIPEYNWLPNAVKKIAEFMPEIVSKGSFHIPTILPMAPKVNISNGMETDISNMFSVGESSGITGILSAALTGLIAADGISK